MIVDYKSIKYSEKFDGFPQHMVSLSAGDYKSRLLLKIKGSLGNHQVCPDALISVSHQNDDENDIEVVASVVLILNEVPSGILTTQNNKEYSYDRAADREAVTRNKIVEDEITDFDLYDESIVNSRHSSRNYELPVSSSSENLKFRSDAVQDSISRPVGGQYKIIHIFESFISH